MVGTKKIPTKLISQNASLSIYQLGNVLIVAVSLNFVKHTLFLCSYVAVVIKDRYQVNHCLRYHLHHY